MQFQSLKLIDPILKALSEEGYTTPTPIQAQAIPLVLEGNDLLGCALLSVKKSTDRRRPIRSLIVTPTRELAIQIGESLQSYGRYTGLTSTVIFGGVNQSRQVTALQNGVDILVATPGRLIDLMNQRFISLKDIEIFVLDEADRMLDMGFIHDVKRLLVALPARRQSLFFSATMPPEIVKLADTILVNPSKVEVTPVSSTADTIKQFMYFVDRGNKNELLVEVLKDKNIKTCLVFTRTKHVADKVLAEYKIKAEAIHGNKSQNARQNALTNFKAQTTRILVATDIAARGIDVDNLEYVINYEIPNIPETYVHRIGRTGRAGANGTAFSFCDAEEKAYLKDIEKLISKKIPVIDEHPFPLRDHNPPKTVQGGRGGGRPQRGPSSSSPSRPKTSGSSSGSGNPSGGSRGPNSGDSKRTSGGSSTSRSGSAGGPPKKRW
jgi:ATP-dependent RNA helicase RhlE